jgi:hypothetical protein
MGRYLNIKHWFCYGMCIIWFLLGFYLGYYMGENYLFYKYIDCKTNLSMMENYKDVR